MIGRTISGYASNPEVTAREQAQRGSGYRLREAAASSSPLWSLSARDARGVRAAYHRTVTVRSAFICSVQKKPFTESQPVHVAAGCGSA